MVGHRKLSVPPLLSKTHEVDLQTPYVLNLLYGVTISAILLETSIP